VDYPKLGRSRHGWTEPRRQRCPQNRMERLLGGGPLGRHGSGGATGDQTRLVQAEVAAHKAEFAALSQPEQEQQLMRWAGSLRGEPPPTSPPAATLRLYQRNIEDATTLAVARASRLRREGGSVAGATIDGELANTRRSLQSGHGRSDVGANLALRQLLDQNQETARCQACGRFVAGESDTVACEHCGGQRPPQADTVINTPITVRYTPALAGETPPASSALTRFTNSANVTVSGQPAPNQQGEVRTQAGLLPQDIAAILETAAVPTEESDGMKAYYGNYLAALTSSEVAVQFGDGSWTSWGDKGVTVQIDPYPITKAEAIRCGLARGGIKSAAIPQLRSQLEARGVKITPAMDSVEAMCHATHEAAHMLHSTRSSTAAVFAFASGQGQSPGLDGKDVTVAAVYQQVQVADPALWQRCQSWLTQPVDPNPSGRYSQSKRQVAAQISNILADGHDERCHLAGDFARIAAGNALHERWTFDPQTDSDWQQLQGAMLYEALPGKSVPLADLKPQVRQLFEQELQPLVEAAVRGSSTDVVEATFKIYDILDQHGYLDAEQSRARQQGGKAFDKGAGNESCDKVTGGAKPGQGGQPGGGGSGDEPAGGGSGDEPADKEVGAQAGSGAGQPGDDAGQPGNSAGGAGQSDTEAGQPGGKGSGQGSGQGGSEAEQPGPGAGGKQPAQAADALKEAEEALRRAGQSQTAALGNKLAAGSFRYEGPTFGNGATSNEQEFAQRRARLGGIARRFAVEIERIKTAAIRDRKFQEQGRLDRGRLTAAAKGRRDVFYAPGHAVALDMASVVVADTSGSMGGQYEKLADALTVCNLAFDQVRVPHELWSFGDEVHLHKSFGQTTAAGVENVAAYPDKGSTNMTDAILLATKRLKGRKEKQPVIYVATDGEPDEGDSARKAVIAARRAGITVFGIFMGRGSRDSIRQTMGALFDQDFAIVEQVEDFPTVVGGQLIQSMKKQLKLAKEHDGEQPSGQSGGRGRYRGVVPLHRAGDEWW